MSQHGLPVAAIALLALACPAPKPAEAPARPAAPVPRVVEVEPLAPVAVGEFVVAPRGTVLYADVGMKTPALKLGADAAPVALRVVELQDKTVAVTTLASRHCGSENRPAWWAELALFVPESSLADVLTQEFEQEYDDGTRVRLTPGIVVGETTVSVPLRGGRDLELAVSVPRSSTGRSYAGHKAVALGATTKGTVKATDAVIGGVRFGLPEGTPVYGGLPGARGYMTQIGGECFAATVRVSESDLGDLDDEDVWGGLTGTEIGEAFALSGKPGEEYFEVAAGTEIKWSSGEPAGRLLSMATFSDGPNRVGGMRCFSPPGQGWDEAARFCFEADKVAVLVHKARGGGGTGEGTIGLGNVGLIGKGAGGGTGSGYGRGSGAGFGGRGKRVPRVRQAKATVKGKLDTDIIRRIVRAHINEVRHCYYQGLTRNPDLKGRVAIKFTINGATGKVKASAVKQNSLKGDAVAKCVAKAVLRWKFPKSGDKKDVKVTYPFLLSPG